jgi:hypothetical protein
MVSSGWGLHEYLIHFAPLALVDQCQYDIRMKLSPTLMFQFIFTDISLPQTIPLDFVSYSRINPSNYTWCLINMYNASLLPVLPRLLAQGLARRPAFETFFIIYSSFFPPFINRFTSIDSKDIDGVVMLRDTLVVCPLYISLYIYIKITLDGVSAPPLSIWESYPHILPPYIRDPSYGCHVYVYLGSSTLIMNHPIIISTLGHEISCTYIPSSYTYRYSCTASPSEAPFGN